MYNVHADDAAALAQMGMRRCDRRDVLLALTGAKTSRIVVTSSVRDQLTNASARWAGLHVVAARRFVARRARSGALVAHECHIKGAAERTLWHELFVKRPVRRSDAFDELHKLAACGDNDQIGAALGIPRCCRAAYVSATVRRLSMLQLEAQLVDRRITLSPLVNPLASAFDRGLLGFQPCSLACRHALRRAIANAECLASCDAALLSAMLPTGTFARLPAGGAIWLQSVPPGLSGPCWIREYVGLDPRSSANIGQRALVALREGDAGEPPALRIQVGKRPRRLRCLHAFVASWLAHPLSLGLPIAPKPFPRSEMAERRSLNVILLEWGPSYESMRFLAYSLASAGVTVHVCDAVPRLSASLITDVLEQFPTADLRLISARELRSGRSAPRAMVKGVVDDGIPRQDKSHWLQYCRRLRLSGCGIASFVRPSSPAHEVAKQVTRADAKARARQITISERELSQDWRFGRQGRALRNRELLVRAIASVARTGREILFTLT